MKVMDHLQILPKILLLFLDKGLSMNQKIIYPNENGSVSLIIPASDCELTIQEIARKDVPEGKPYLIVDDSDLPEDHVFFNAWEADFTNPDGVGIGAEAWFAEQEVGETE
jgi:hypothetical protein